VAGDPNADGDFTIGPDYTPAPECAVSPGIPRGTIHVLAMDSRDSKIYPGIRRIENDITRRRDAHGNRIATAEAEQSIAAPYTRTVWVYVPSQHVKGTPAPLLVVQDGHGYLNLVPRVLDNLIAAGRVPASRSADRFRRRRCARKPARAGIRHALGPLQRFR
jgi:hypothetical protein